VDALEGLAGLPRESVDLIVTDPPYNTLEEHRSHGTTTRLSHSKRSSNDWFQVVEMEYLVRSLAHFYRILKRDRHTYIFCDWHTARVLSPAAEEAGFKVRKPIICEKVGRMKPVYCPACSTHVLDSRGKGKPGMGYPYRSSYEVILFLQKGKRPFSGRRDVRDVMKFPRVDRKDAYPTEKPVPLIEVLIGQSSEPRELVLDPFSGSGATLKAADNLGRLFLGFDTNPGALERFKLRGGEGGWTRSEVPRPVSKPQRKWMKSFRRENEEVPSTSES
jgi:site-specific DNA-methyltransferase (adenine-specific)